MPVRRRGKGPGGGQFAPGEQCEQVIAGEPLEVPDIVTTSNPLPPPWEKIYPTDEEIENYLDLLEQAKQAKKPDGHDPEAAAAD